MAMTPTTITCCRISEKFSPVRKRSVCVAKKTQASSRAMNGPERAERRQLVASSVCAEAAGGACPVARGAALYFLPQHRSVPILASLLSTPAIGLSAISVTPVSV